MHADDAIAQAINSISDESDDDFLEWDSLCESEPNF
jgi:hypothetical protein